MSTWVRFHMELTQGAKRSLTRTARFIFMELSLHARARRGYIDLRPDVDLVDAVHAELGGGVQERREVAAALPKLMAAKGADGVPMVRVDESDGSRRLVIPSWEAWNTVDESADRARRYREARKNKAPADVVTRDGHKQRDGRERDVTLQEERRGEENRGEERESTLTPAESVVRSELEKARDLWPSPAVATGDLDAVARRAVEEIDDPLNRARGEYVPIAREAVKYARGHRSRFAASTPEQSLAAFEQKVGWVLDDYRKGNRKPKAQAGPVGSMSVDDDFAANAVRDMETLERKTRRGGEPSSVGDLLGAVKR